MHIPSRTSFVAPIIQWMRVHFCTNYREASDCHTGLRSSLYSRRSAERPSTASAMQHPSAVPSVSNFIRQLPWHRMFSPRTHPVISTNIRHCLLARLSQGNIQDTKSLTRKLVQPGLEEGTMCVSAHGSGSGATNKHGDIAPSTWFLVPSLLYLCFPKLGIESRRLEPIKYHNIDVTRRFMLKSFVCHSDNLQQMFGSLG